jgi:pyruvate dehydrogenase E2 component (dihydrolipoamide acetyltransferase)
MAEILRMPEVAANAVEAVLQSWPIPANTPYAKGDVIATVETEKAVVDVEAEADGIIVRTLVPEGAEVRVGDPIAVVGAPGEKPDAAEAVLTSLNTESAAAPVSSAASATTAGAVAGADPVAEPMTVAAGVGGPEAGTGQRRVFASPLARRLAKEAGLGVKSISGSGPNGRIIRRDVEAAIRDRTPAEPEPTIAYTDVPHSRMRAAIAGRLTESKRTTPHFYLRGTADAGRLLDLRRELNGGPVKVSVNDLVLKAAARAHVLVPAMNVIWTPDAVRTFPSVDVSVAIATPRGLVTPVLRAAEQLTVSTVAATVKDFAERAEAGRLRQGELEGGTFTVTNLGMYGTEEFAAIINPPQSAILAIGAVHEEPVVRDGELTIGSVMRVTLSVDHRPIDGTTAAEWMRAFLSLIEHPAQILI